MRKYLGVLIVILLAVMALTNPTQDEYQTWAKSQIVATGDNVIEKGLLSWLGGSVVNNTTSTRNFLVLSIYTTELDKETSFKTVGLLGNFVQISAPKLEENKSKENPKKE